VEKCFGVDIVAIMLGFVYPIKAQGISTDISYTFIHHACCRYVDVQFPFPYQQDLTIGTEIGFFEINDLKRN
jgi:hypothetical protein